MRRPKHCWKTRKIVRSILQQLLFISTMTAFGASAAQSALILTDSEFGPNSIVKDTVSGREYLHSSITKQFTSLQIWNGFQPGGLFEEFEYKGLPFSWPEFPFTQEEFLAFRDEVVMLFPEYPGHESLDSVSYNGISGMDLEETTGQFVMYAVTFVLLADGSSYTDHQHIWISTSVDSSGLAHFLSRSTIPEHSTYLLLITGLIGLICLKKSRNKRN